MDKKIQLRLLDGSPEQMAELQRVLEEAPDYAMRVTGHPPGQAEAQSTYSALPPAKTYDDKFVYGIYLGDSMVGCVDLIRGYPDAATAMLGLLAISEKHQHKGYGKVAFERLEEIIREWPGVGTIRIGVVASNDIVMPFWRAMGFTDTGIRKAHKYDKLETETLVFHKSLASGIT